MDKGFHDAIKAYLDMRAAAEPEFMAKYVARMKADKNSILQCCSYIIKEVRKSNRTAYTDAEIYGMAVHFFDEGLTDNGDAPKVRVVVPGEEMTEEMAAAPVEKPKARAERKPKPKTQADDAQLSLF